MESAYCSSRFQTIRRSTRIVKIGNLSLGGNYPIRVQSMTTTDTLDVEATFKQTIELAEAGCEIVRITAPNLRAAQALGLISKKLQSANLEIPLVADIHFMPDAAMEAAKHVEKVRINPGNYADRKKFMIREYTDSQYEKELNRLHQKFSPLVLRCKELGRAMRIGTNHGSLSDRIMNRFGDTPRGMAESALEFLRIAESHGYHDIVLSMKSSNPKVMIQAYRLVVSLMNEEGMNYPLHLGVTEAGDGEDARIKSAIGIGSLLLDGLGDTIRVSLTEDPVAEIPVARALADRSELWTSKQKTSSFEIDEFIDPYNFSRRSCPVVELGQPALKIGTNHVPAVFASTDHTLKRSTEIIQEVAQIQTKSKDAKVEGLILRLTQSSELSDLQTIAQSLFGAVSMIIVDDQRENDDELLTDTTECVPFVWHRQKAAEDDAELARFLTFCDQAGHYPAISLLPEKLSAGTVSILETAPKPPIVSLVPSDSCHGVSGFRMLVSVLEEAKISHPIWIRNHSADPLSAKNKDFSEKLLDASILSGSLLCDGIGDILSIENLGSLERNRGLAYNILQGARARICKTEFVACPSCGRTLFDLQSTTNKIKSATGHLKGVTIAVMGCIVNGPGEMADADFGYVGSGPGKIDLYVGKNRVQSAVLENDAVGRLIDLIKDEGKWIAP